MHLRGEEVHDRRLRQRMESSPTRITRPRHYLKEPGHDVARDGRIHGGGSEVSEGEHPLAVENITWGLRGKKMFWTRNAPRLCRTVRTLVPPGCSAGSVPTDAALEEEVVDYAGAGEAHDESYHTLREEMGSADPGRPRKPDAPNVKQGHKLRSNRGGDGHSMQTSRANTNHNGKGTKQEQYSEGGSILVQPAR